MKSYFVIGSMIIAVLSTFLAVDVTAEECNIEVDCVESEASAWCWAAAMKCVTSYYTTTYEQCDIVYWVSVNGLFGDVSYNYTATHCCAPSYPCDNFAPWQANLLNIYNNYTFTYHREVQEEAPGGYTVGELKSQICSQYPVIIVFTGTGSHAVVLYAVDDTTGELAVMDTKYGADAEWTYNDLAGGNVTYGTWLCSDVIKGFTPNGDIPPGDTSTRVKYFVARSSEGGVECAWETRYEFNTSHFIVEKKYDSGFMAVSGEIIAMGGSSDGERYRYTDPFGKTGDVYRLMEIENTNALNPVDEATAAVESVPETFDGDERRTSRAFIASEERERMRSLDGEKAQPMSPTIENYKWVAIYPELFEEEMEFLLSWRTQNGLFATGITYEEVVAQYGDIRSYIQHLWDTQYHSLKYVFIVGDYTGEYPRIPINRYQEGWVDNFYVDFYSDYELGDVNGDGLPEIAVGRLPAQTESDVSTYVNKVWRYDDYQFGTGWVDNASVFSYDKDATNGCIGSHVEYFANELMELFPGSFAVHDLSYKEYQEEYQEDFTASQRLFITKMEFNNGRSLILALGSSSTAWKLVQWVLTIGDAPISRSSFLVNYRYAFVVGASCHMNDFTDSYPPSLARELLMAPGNGAIGMFGPAGGSMSFANYHVSTVLLKYLYEYGAPSAGYACLAAQRQIMQNPYSPYSNTARAYVYLGDPAIKIMGSVYSNGNPLPYCNMTFEYPESSLNFLLGCPLGDTDTFVVDAALGFGFNPYDIPASDITLDNHSASDKFTVFYDDPNTVFELDPLPSDRDANSGNAYTTTFTPSNVGGCGYDYLIARVNGDSVGAVWLSVKSADINGDGYTNISDFSFLGGTYNKSYGAVGYNDCCDFTGDGCVNLSDFSYFGDHYTHSFDWGERRGTLLSSTGSPSEIMLDIAETTSDEDRNAKATVRLGNCGELSGLCMLFTLNGDHLKYAGWETSPRCPFTVNTCLIEREEGEVIFISSLGKTGEPNAGEIEIGAMKLVRISDRDISEDDVRFLAGEVMDARRAASKIRGARANVKREEIPVPRNYLSCNYPNPFNPATAIEFSIGEDTNVNLSIYNVNGQLIRTLLNQPMKRNRYRVVWDGTDNRGNTVASAVYFYRIKTNGFTMTKKMVLLR